MLSKSTLVSETNRHYITGVYSSVPNRRICTFISGKVYLLSSIDVKRQTLTEINVHARLFGRVKRAF